MKTNNEISKALIERRKKLRLDQKDMKSRIGMSQQQYSRLESNGDMKLSTFLRILEGLEMELKLIPKEELKIESIINDYIKNYPEIVDEYFNNSVNNLKNVDLHKNLNHSYVRNKPKPNSFEDKLKALEDHD
ncbi:hypothetical protein JCM30760_21420 [Thiomicrorhabdus hydrogeniphila]